MARIMAVDYGIKRIGLAVTDPLQIIANGLDTVSTDKIWDFLENYFQQEEVEQLVIGEPTHLDGTPTYLEDNISKFILEFKAKYPKIIVDRQDERMTSVSAREIILQSGAKKKKRRDKSLIDKVSAVLILQDYMERKRNNIL